MSARSSRRTIKTAVIVAIGVAMMAVVVPVTVAGTMRTGNPSVARRIAPFDALASATAAYQGITLVPQPRWAQSDALAAQALRRDPTAVAAVVTRGLVAEQRGDQPAARRWFEYADRLGKRDFATQLWFIEDRVRAGDVKGVLARYDLALRASPGASTVLYPILTQAAAAPEVGAALNVLLRTRPAWGSSFVSHLIRTSSDPAAIIRVTTGVIDRDSVNGKDQMAALVGRLVAAGQYDLAWRAYRAFGRPGGGGTVVRDGSFADPASVGAFEWSYADALPLAPEHGLEGGRPVLFLPANPDQDGEAVRQLVRLGEGAWRLSARIGASTQSGADAPRLTVRCADAPERPLIEIPFRPAPAEAMLTGEFSAPPACGYAWLAIAVRQPTEPTSAARAYITDVALRRR